MHNKMFTDKLHQCFSKPLQVNENFIIECESSGAVNQQQTNDVFSEKWSQYNKSGEKENLYQFQREWYLKLYGFDTEDDLAKFLSSKKVILDAGCGLGYKAAWFAKLAPDSLVIGMDFSEAAREAALCYKHLSNLYFIQADIAKTGLITGSIDYTSCDQVIMHTEMPEETFEELARITSKDAGDFACYFYAKKALPRELLDDHFRIKCSDMSNDELWQMSKDLTILGKKLSELNLKFDCPEVPSLGIKGGEIDVQRFIYWNFMKCFWNEDLGYDTSLATNFDWYSPSNAKRFSEIEVNKIVESNDMQIKYFHKEDACYSGRFIHRQTEV